MSPYRHVDLTPPAKPKWLKEWLNEKKYVIIAFCVFFLLGWMAYSKYNDVISFHEMGRALCVSEGYHFHNAHHLSGEVICVDRPTRERHRYICNQDPDSCFIIVNRYAP